MPDRSPTPSPIVVEPATPERWADVVALMDGDGDRGCWCQYWRQSAGDYSRGAPGAARRRLRAQVADVPPPGLIAYLDGEPVGWCGFGPRPSLERLVRSRTIPAIDEVPVWSVVCFRVRPGYRRRGVANALLDGVVALARRSGAPGVEAYPIDPEGGRVDVTFGYVGVTSMFERAGFRRVLETAARSDRRSRWLMRLELGDG